MITTHNNDTYDKPWHPLFKSSFQISTSSGYPYCAYTCCIRVANRGIPGVGSFETHSLKSWSEQYTSKNASIMLVYESGSPRLQCSTTSGRKLLFLNTTVLTWVWKYVLGAWTINHVSGMIRRGLLFKSLTTYVKWDQLFGFYYTQPQFPITYQSIGFHTRIIIENAFTFIFLANP